MNATEDEKGNLILENGEVIPEEKRQKAEVYSRVVGYLRPVSQYNKGKQEEFKKRKMFNLSEER
jgi:ribonucleoside-triphosphate reductase